MGRRLTCELFICEEVKVKWFQALAQNIIYNFFTFLMRSFLTSSSSSSYFVCVVHCAMLRRYKMIFCVCTFSVCDHCIYGTPLETTLSNENKWIGLLSWDYKTVCWWTGWASPNLIILKCRRNSMKRKSTRKSLRCIYLYWMCCLSASRYDDNNQITIHLTKKIVNLNVFKYFLWVQYKIPYIWQHICHRYTV